MAALSSVAQVLRVIYEPGEVFWEVKQKPPLVSALVMLALALLVRIFNIYVTSFHFSLTDPESTNIVAELSQLFVPLLSWVVASYGVALIMEGEGTFKQIFIACSLSLLPYVIVTPLQTLLTNVLALSEGVWVRAVQTAVYWWCLYLLYTAVRVIYNYDDIRALVVMGLALFLMLLAWAILGIIYSYTDQVIRFVREVLLEVAIR